jgi:hypothetical protein
MEALKVVTFNVWFKEWKKVERSEALIALEQTAPDVMYFQEGTNATVLWGIGPTTDSDERLFCNLSPKPSEYEKAFGFRTACLRTFMAMANW